MKDKKGNIEFVNFGENVNGEKLSFECSFSKMPTKVLGDNQKISSWEPFEFEIIDGMKNAVEEITEQLQAQFDAYNQKPEPEHRR